VPSYEIDHPDRYALQMVATVLGGGMSSRLFTEVRERRGLAYYVYGLNHSYTDTGSLYSQAGVDINRIDEALTTIATELKGMTDKVPADELEKARRAASSCSWRTRRGSSGSGCARRSSSGALRIPTRCSQESPPSRSTTCSASRGTSSRTSA